MFAYLQVAFAMFSFCYAQQPSYLQHTIFPAPSILQHYIEFDARIVAMLEKLLGSGSFGTTVGHLVSCQVIFLASSRGLGLPSVVQCATPTFLRCWALIAFALMSRFQ